MEIFEEFHIKMSFQMKKGLKFGYLLQVDFKGSLNSLEKLIFKYKVNVYRQFQFKFQAPSEGYTNFKTATYHYKDKQDLKLAKSD